jgi:dGTPase
MEMGDSYTDFDKERRYTQASKQPNRDPFETDKGRIIHSGAFRRLQGKTQVLGVGERDFYRTRLTHSLEVAQLGRGICVEVRSGFEINQDLVEAICLAHDIGHPAFGHFGEEVLHEKMIAFGGFGANPQNIRIVRFLEAKFTQGGLDLTRATLDGLIKYPVLFDKKKHPADKKPKFTYVGDKDLYKWVKKGIRDPLRKPIEGQVADWADQVAYCVNDIEDGIRAGLLNLLEMEERADELSSAVRDDIKLDVPGITGAEAIRRRAKALQEELVRPTDLRIRKINLKSWTSDVIKDLLHGIKIERTHPKENCVRYQYSLIPTPSALALAALLKATAFKLIFENPRVKTLEHKGGLILRRLFDTFLKDVSLLPVDFQQLIKKDPKSTPRLVADFVAGMTDRYAYSYYSRLFEPGFGSFYENV